eukprot:998898-Amorphochlora_amoeboformis.AAC.1
MKSLSSFGSTINTNNTSINHTHPVNNTLPTLTKRLINHTPTHATTHANRTTHQPNITTHHAPQLHGNNTPS